MSTVRQTVPGEVEVGGITSGCTECDRLGVDNLWGLRKRIENLPLSYTSSVGKDVLHGQ